MSIKSVESALRTLHIDLAQVDDVMDKMAQTMSNVRDFESAVYDGIRDASADVTVSDQDLECELLELVTSDALRHKREQHLFSEDEDEHENTFCQDVDPEIQSDTHSLMANPVQHTHRTFGRQVAATTE